MERAQEASVHSRLTAVSPEVNKEKGMCFYQVYKRALVTEHEQGELVLYLPKKKKKSLW